MCGEDDSVLAKALVCRVDLTSEVHPLVSIRAKVSFKPGMDLISVCHFPRLHLG